MCRLWENEYTHNAHSRRLARATRLYYSRRVFKSFEPVPFEHNDLSVSSTGCGPLRPQTTSSQPPYITSIEFDAFGALCAVASSNGRVAVHDIECGLTAALAASTEDADIYRKYMSSSAAATASAADCTRCGLTAAACDCPPASAQYRARPSNGYLRLSFFSCVASSYMLSCTLRLVCA
jgi:hypothetical protein